MLLKRCPGTSFLGNEEAEGQMISWFPVIPELLDFFNGCVRPQMEDFSAVVHSAANVL